MLVTFATSWYCLTSKFSVNTYVEWMRHMLAEVNHYYLVIFTDEAGERVLRTHFAGYLINPHIKIVQKPVEEWYNYKYKAEWLKNHEQNHFLNQNSKWKCDWKLNMLWAEKTHFVNTARVNQYFPATEFYGWCDIGYFRLGSCPTFAAPSKIEALNKNKIYYTCVRPWQLNQLKHESSERNAIGLPVRPIRPDQSSVAGGFFIAHHSKIEGWKNIFDRKLALYFQENYLVKDDQIIIVDCILAEPYRFELLVGPEPDPGEHNWFYFRHFLSL
jgi:hypothetical protein